MWTELLETSKANKAANDAAVCLSFPSTCVSSILLVIMILYSIWLFDPSVNWAGAAPGRLLQAQLQGIFRVCGGNPLYQTLVDI